MRVMFCIASNEQCYTDELRTICHKLGIMPVVVTDDLTSGDIVDRAYTLEVDAVCISSPYTLSNVLERRINGAAKDTFAEWAGSRLRDLEYSLDMTAMAIQPLKYFRAKPYGKYIMEKHLAKLFGVSALREPDWQVVTKSKRLDALADLKAAKLVAIDIETSHHLLMTVVGYCCLLPDGNLRTWVVDMTVGVPTEWQLDFVRHANLTPAPKVMHNGMYDSSYFARYSAPVYNYTLDTEYLFYSIYSELPKRLFEVSAFYLSNVEYWKDTGGADILEYNARDCEFTLLSCVAMLVTMPAYAKTNYAKLFNTLPPALFMSMHGVKVDKEEMKAKEVVSEKYIAESKSELRQLLGGFDINVNSPKQIAFLLYKVLGVKPVTVKGKRGTTCAIALKRISASDPLAARLIKLIVYARKESKAVSTYFKADLLNSRMLYSYRIDGTETGRFSCSKHNFGKDGKSSYGTQIQNIPYYAKSAIIPDTGYTMGDNDLSQAEARCTAHLANDTVLITAIEHPTRDFYKLCGSLFFQLPYEEVTDELRNKVIKKIIHGTNYMMGAGTFMDTIGIVQLLELKTQLGYDHFSPRQFASHLLGLYHEAYPSIKPWYKKLQQELIRTGKLVSPGGLTRRFFGDPREHDTLRSAVAHWPQSTSVALINSVLIDTFWLIQVPSRGEFCMQAQVHDSLLWQAKAGSETKYSEAIKDLMERPVAMPHGTTMVIPADGATGTTWAGCK